jgi:hypothetical protein
MSKIGDALAKVAPEENEEAAPESEDSDGGEVSAARLMMKAKTPEAYASALKDFLELCVPKIMEGKY